MVGLIVQEQATQFIAGGRDSGDVRHREGVANRIVRVGHINHARTELANRLDQLPEAKRALPEIIKTIHRRPAFLDHVLELFIGGIDDQNMVAIAQKGGRHQLDHHVGAVGDEDVALFGPAVARDGGLEGRGFRLRVPVIIAVVFHELAQPLAHSRGR